MSDTGNSARPRQLTMAAGFVIGGSVLLVLSAFDKLTRLHSIDTRAAVVQFVDTPLGGVLGLDVSDSLAVWKVVLMVAAACAAATAVLGGYALMRSRAARLALSILAVPILLTSPLTGVLTGAVIAAATVMLWSGPARDWFAGRPIRQVEPATRDSGSGSNAWETTMPPAGPSHDEDQAPAGPGAEAGGPPDDVPETPPASSLSTAGSSRQPGAMTGYGERTAGPVAGQGAAWVPPPYAAVGRVSAVPVTVKIACVLTWVFSGVVALLYLGLMVVLVVAQDRMVDYVVKVPEWERANLDQGMILPVLWFGCLLFLGWSLGACVLAWFTWRRHNWARWLLVASASATLVAALFAFPVGILHQLAAALTIGGLLGAAPREWFANRQRPPGPPPPSGWGPPQGGQYPPQQGQYPPQQGPGPGPGQGQAPPPGGKPPVW